MRMILFCHKKVFFYQDGQKAIAFTATYWF